MLAGTVLSRRRFLSTIGLLGGTSILAACVAPQAAAPGGGEAAPAAAEGVALIVDTRDSEVQFMTETLPWFQEEHPDVTAEFRGYPGNDYFTKILALAAANEVGDMVWGNISGGQYMNLGVKGIIIPLDDFAEADNYDFSPFFASTVESCRFDGRLYSMPLSGMPSQRPLFYNTELMDGVEYDMTENWDWTTDDLVAAAETLTKREGGEVTQWGFVPDVQYFGLVPWIRTFGGDLLSDDGRTCVINSPAAAECVNFLLSLSQEHGVSPTPEEMQGQPRDMFLGRQCAMTQLSTGALTSIRGATDFEYGASVAPRHPVNGRSDMNAALHIGVTANSQHQQTAYDLAAHYCTREVGIYKLNTPSGMPAGRPDVYSSDEAIALHPGFPLLSEAGAWSKVHTLPWNLRGAEVIATLQNNMDQIWLGQMSVEDGLALVQQEVQVALDKPMA
jgi:multiple sugar transport system substrate-binding protein